MLGEVVTVAKLSDVPEAYYSACRSCWGDREALDLTPTTALERSINVGRLAEFMVLVIPAFPSLEPCVSLNALKKLC